MPYKSFVQPETIQPFMPNHPIPTAWDYHFSKLEVSQMLVTLKSGRRIMGRYGCKSFASSSPNERDLYLEEATELRQTENGVNDQNYHAILICKDTIETIEFLD